MGIEVISKKIRFKSKKWKLMYVGLYSIRVSFPHRRSISFGNPGGWSWVMVRSLNCQHEVTEKLLGTGLVLYEEHLATQGLLRH